MKNCNKSVKVVVLVVLEINKVSGGESYYCDCMNEKATCATELNSEIICKQWCCDSGHASLGNKHGEFYRWSNSIEEPFKLCK